MHAQKSQEEHNTGKKAKTDDIIQKSKKRRKALESLIKEFKKTNCLTLILFLPIICSAQGVIISDDGSFTGISNNSLLEIMAENNDKGIIIPRLTSSERSAISLSSTNDKGLLVYDTDEKSFWYYNGTSWVEAGSTIRSISDEDGDTKIQLEESTNDNNIRFDVAGNEAVVIDENSNMGIGTDNPGSKLEIAEVASTGNEDALRIGLDGEYQASIKFYDDDAESTQHFGISFDAGAQDLKIYSDDVDNMLYFTQDGKIGAGTSSPERSKIHISGSGSFDGMLRLENTGTGGTDFFLGSTNNNWSMAKGDFVMGHGNPGESSIDFVLSQEGYVGIGTTSPENALEVNGTVKISNYTMPTENGTNGQVLKTNGSGSAYWGDDDNTVCWSENGGNVYRSNGNVGIGTSTPSAKMDIAFDGNFGTETLDQVQTSYRVGESMEEMWWQSITTGMSGYVSKISLRYGPVTQGTFCLKIYNGQGTSGTLLGYSEELTFSDSNYGWIDFNMLDGIDLSSGQQFTMVMEVDSGETWESRYEYGNIYAGGVMYRRGEVFTDYDMPFRTYMGSSYTPPGNFLVNSSSELAFGTNAATGIEGIKLQTDYNSGQSSGRLFFIEDDAEAYGFSFIFAGLDNPSFGGTNFNLETNTMYILRHNNSTSGDVAMSIKRSNGYVGIGTAEPSYLLEVNGVAAKPGGGFWTNSSDKRLKDIQGSYKKGIESIIQMNPVEFKYKKNNTRNLPDNVIYQGFIAQDVQKVFPEAVSEGDDGYLNLDLQSINMAMINSIKELKKENEILVSKNRELEERINKLEDIMIKSIKN